MKLTKKQALLAIVPFVLMLVVSIPFIVDYYWNDGEYAIGDSMRPAFGHVTVVFMKTEIPDSNLEGEIVTFSFDETKREIIHRVVKDDRKKRGIVITKGDNNEFSDGCVSREELTGVVARYENGYKYILSHVLFLIGLVGLGIIAYFGVDE
jgi:signal peptidase